MSASCRSSNRAHIRLRVYERGAGETLACGTGACAAVVAGIRLGLLDAKVDVEARGGTLTIEWAGAPSPVQMWIYKAWTRVSSANRLILLALIGLSA